MTRGRHVKREPEPAPSLGRLIAGPLHFVEFGRAQQEWLRSVEVDQVKLSPNQRYSLIAMFYRHATQPKPLPRGAMDEFLEGLAAFYRCAGGSTLLTGQNHTVPDAPFATFLMRVWNALPRSHRPASEKQMMSRTRRLVEHKVDWDRQEDRRVEWDSRTGHKVVLRIVRPKGLTRAQIQRFSLGGRKVGEMFSVNANLSYGKPRRLEPVNHFWRKRLKEGSVKNRQKAA